MSVHVTSWVLKNSEETLGRRLVLLVLADHAGEDGENVWVSVATIAHESRMSERQAQRCLSELRRSGAIEETGQHRSGTRIYAVRMGGDNMSPIVRGDISDVLGVSEMSPEPSLEPSLVEEATKDVASSTSRPPKLTKIGGRDLAFDALAEVCGISEGSPRLSEVAVALNGARGRPGIREQAWAEIEFGWEHGEETWERSLRSRIFDRAKKYREKMPGAALTPPALAKWWTDLPGLPDPRNGRSGSAKDALPIAEAAVQKARETR